MALARLVNTLRVGWSDRSPGSTSAGGGLGRADMSARSRCSGAAIILPSRQAEKCQAYRCGRGRGARGGRTSPARCSSPSSRSSLARMASIVIALRRSASSRMADATSGGTGLARRRVPATPRCSPSPDRPPPPGPCAGSTGRGGPSRRRRRPAPTAPGRWRRRPGPSGPRDRRWKAPFPVAILPAHERSMAARLPRLRLRLVHQCDGVQPRRTPCR